MLFVTVHLISTWVSCSWYKDVRLASTPEQAELYQVNDLRMTVSNYQGCRIDQLADPLRQKMCVVCAVHVGA